MSRVIRSRTTASTAATARGSAPAPGLRAEPPLDYYFTGLTVVPGTQRVVLGWGSKLHLYDAKAQRLGKSLALDVVDISGLAVEGDRLLVLEGSSGKLSSLPLVSLE